MTTRRQMFALRPDGFPWLIARLPKRARQAGLTVEVCEAPLFGPEADAEASLDALEDRSLAPQSLRIEHWSAFPGHEMAALTFGPGALRRARRAVGRVTEGKGRAKFLYEVDETEGFDPTLSRLAGWRLDPENDQHRSLLADRTRGTEGEGEITVYLADAFPLEGDAFEASPTAEESAQADDFEIVARPAADLVLVRPLAPRAHEHLWRHAAAGRGIVGFETADDPAIPHLVSRFDDGADLEIVFFIAPSEAARLSLGRSATTPDLAILYRPDAQPGGLDLTESGQMALAG